MPPKRRTPAIHRIDADEIRAADIPGKGMGLVAVVDLPPNARLPFLGKTIDQKTYDTFVSRTARAPDKHYTDYIMATSTAGQYVDANPRYRGSEQWLARLVNEPATGQTANMVIRYESRMPVLVTVKKIAAGTELMLSYGSDFVRKYKVGRRAAKPAWLR